jgi:hypothetical protein
MFKPIEKITNSQSQSLASSGIGFGQPTNQKQEGSQINANPHRSAG